MVTTRIANIQNYGDVSLVTTVRIVEIDDDFYEFRMVFAESNVEWYVPKKLDTILTHIFDSFSVE